MGEIAGVGMYGTKAVIIVLKGKDSSILYNVAHASRNSTCDVQVEAMNAQ